MQTELISNDIRRFVVENFLSERAGNLQDQDSFLEKGLIDSTGVMELIAFLEERYSITVEDQEVVPENLDSIANVAAYVSKKLNGRA